jgi:hypothetical protein
MPFPAQVAPGMGNGARQVGGHRRVMSEMDGMMGGPIDDQDVKRPRMYPPAGQYPG